MERKKPKFKIGDVLVCVNNYTPHQKGGGSGWVKGLVFKVKEISPGYIYWPAFEGHGVYEDHLELNESYYKHHEELRTKIKVGIDAGKPMEELMDMLKELSK